MLRFPNSLSRRAGFDAILVFRGGNISKNISGKCRWDLIPCRPIPLFWMPGRSDNPRLVSRDFPAHLRSPQVTAGDHSATGHAGYCKIPRNPSGNHKCLWFRFPRQSGNLKGNPMVLIGKQKFHTSGNELVRNTGKIRGGLFLFQMQSVMAVWLGKIFRSGIIVPFTSKNILSLKI